MERTSEDRRPPTRAVYANEIGRKKRRAVQRGDASLISLVDGRSLMAKRYKEIAAQLIADQGGSDLSEVRLQLLRRFAASCVLAEQLEAQLAAGNAIDIAEHAQIVSSLVRVAHRVGIDRIPKNVTPSLRDYLDARSEPEPSEEYEGADE